LAIAVAGIGAAAFIVAFAMDAFATVACGAGFVAFATATVACGAAFVAFATVACGAAFGVFTAACLTPEGAAGTAGFCAETGALTPVAVRSAGWEGFCGVVAVPADAVAANVAAKNIAGVNMRRIGFAFSNSAAMLTVLL
jgi:hypothetical protein